jgi:uncharacterized protein (UPF0261 family)
MDVTVMHTVVDTVGLNRMVKALAVNGAKAISGMVEGRALSSESSKPLLAVTEFGYCDQGAHLLREILEPEHEIVFFHATGVSDRSLVALAAQGSFAAIIDLVPGTFSERLLGGNRPSGEDRLDVAKDVLIPYILCPGGFDLISCGPMERKNKPDDPLWVSRRLADRKLYNQDDLRVQARMSPEESEQVALAVAAKLNEYICPGRVKVVIPERGFTSLSIENGPLHDPAADQAFIMALENHLLKEIAVIKVDTDINSPEFANIVAKVLADAQRVCR